MKRAVILIGIVGALGLGFLWVGSAAGRPLGARMTFARPAVSACAAPACDGVVTFSVQDPGVLAPDVPAIERAVQIQVNVQLRAHWSVPQIAFAAGGVPIVSESADAVVRDCGSEGDGMLVYGCHRPDAIYVLAVQDTSALAVGGWSTDLSHEIIEALVDPSGTSALSGLLAEPCDPVAGDFYSVDNVLVSDFAYPRWFTAGSRGPWDWMHQTPRALRVDAIAGGYAPPPTQT